MTRWILTCILLAMAAYHMPWQVHEAAVFSNNALDLAEGISLHPDVQAESPKLYTSMLLRLPLVFLAVLTILTAGRLSSEAWRWLWRGVAVLMVLRLNPPVEFYPWGGGSENDQQLGMMMVVGLAILGGLMLTGRWMVRVYHPLMLLLVAIMLLVAFGGYQRATDILDRIMLETTMGGGFVLFIAAGIVMAGLVAWEWWQVRTPNIKAGLRFRPAFRQIHRIG